MLEGLPKKHFAPPSSPRPGGRERVLPDFCHLPLPPGNDHEISALGVLGGTGQPAWTISRRGVRNEMACAVLGVCPQAGFRVQVFGFRVLGFSMQPRTRIPSRKVVGSRRRWQCVCSASLVCPHQSTQSSNSLLGIWVPFDTSQRCLCKDRRSGSKTHTVDSLRKPTAPMKQAACEHIWDNAACHGIQLSLGGCAFKRIDRVRDLHALGLAFGSISSRSLPPAHLSQNGRDLRDGKN